MLTRCYLYLKNLFASDEGQDLAEYALLLLLIAIVVVIAVGTLGTNIRDVFKNMADKLVGAAAGGG